MALPASGTISLSQIQTEFGGSNPASLSEYYAADTGVPASGTIKFSDFYGTSAASITLGNLYIVSDIQNGGGEAFAEIKFESDGDIITTTNTSGGSDVGDWINPKASASSSYEIKATYTDAPDLINATFSGTLNTWLNLGTNRSWSMTMPDDGGVDGAGLQIEIRLGSTVLDTTNVSISVSSANEFGGGI